MSHFVFLPSKCSLLYSYFCVFVQEKDQMLYFWDGIIMFGNFCKEKKIKRCFFGGNVKNWHILAGFVFTGQDN